MICNTNAGSERRKAMRLVALRPLLAAFALMASALAGPAAAQGKRLEVVATTAMIGDSVKALGGERVRVEVLLGQGVDPHLYKPTRADIAKMVKADMIVANGLNLEAQFRDTFEQLGRTKPVVLAGEKLPKDQLLADEDYKDKPDPHVWMDPDLWKGVVGAIRDALASRDPAGKQTYVAGDRKSTRLNSSHANISYAVFCLKKKKTKTEVQPTRNAPMFLAAGISSSAFTSLAHGWTAKAP